jgi:hypothetical protein
MHPKPRRIRARPVQRRASQGGIVLIYALFVVVLILILGLAFMQTSALETVENTHSVQHLQATSAAEYGIARARGMAASANNQHGDWYFMTYNGTSLSASWAASPSYSGHSICNLFTNQTVPNIPGATYSVVIEDRSGDVVLSGLYRMHGYGTVGGYTRHVSIDCTALNFSSFGWLTNSETNGGNPVWFITGDTLSGLIWTNGQFNIDGNPTFNGPAYSGSGSLNYMNGGPPNDNPNFTKGINYNAPNLNIGSVLNGNDITAIDTAAKAAGGVLEPSNSGNGYCLIFNAGGTYSIYKLDSSGNQLSPALVNNAAVGSTNGAFYFQDKVLVSGTLTGQVTIATSSGNDIDVVNNLVYSYPASAASMFVAGFNQSDPLLTSKCALISGGNVVVKPSKWSSTLTSPGHGATPYYAYSTAWADAGANMYITATCASVTGSFENFSSYVTSLPQKTLNVYGGIVQITRGVVGKTSGSGFLKNYLYDTRFQTSPPPFLTGMALGATYSNWQLY